MRKSNTNKNTHLHSSNVGLQLLIAACNAAGISKFVVCPGSRSAPLVIEVSGNTENETVVIADERCAGYYAMGMAQQLKQPVAVICTSGTAVLNLAPAVCEAYYQQIPLVVLSADRPSGAAERGENQALLRQEKFLEHFTLHSLDYSTALPMAYMQSAAKVAYQLMAECNGIIKGPVHINVRLDEPLYNTTTDVVNLPDFVPLKTDEVQITLRDLKKMQQAFAHSQQKMLLVGMHAKDNNIQKLITTIGKRSDTVIVQDTLANLHIPEAITQTDACLLLNDKKGKFIAPDCLISIGGTFTSKRLRQFLSKYPPRIHFDLSTAIEGKTKQWLPCMYPFTLRPSAEFVLQALANTPVKTELNYSQKWQIFQTKAIQLKDSFLASAPYSDLTAISEILHHLPPKTNVQLGNSTVVRYAGFNAPNKNCTYNGNRGTSGIDGCVSTAAGAAHIHKDITLCIVGDVSFLYDSNALWNNQLSPRLRIVVINNGGGNIFRWLDGSSGVKNFEKYFETAHTHSAKHLATMFQLPYYICTRQSELLPTFKKFLSKQNRKASILEIKTNNTTSAAVYKQFIAQLTSSTD